VVEGIKFNDKGLVPAIVQDADSGDVLMLGYMNAEALRRTLTSGEVWFYSRSRQQLWHKGKRPATGSWCVKCGKIAIMILFW